MKINELKEINHLISQRKSQLVLQNLTTNEREYFSSTEDIPATHIFKDKMQLCFAQSKSQVLKDEASQEEYFLSIYRPSPKLVILGAVHIAQALAPMARMCGYDVIIIDPRGAFAQAERFMAEEVIAQWPDDVFETRPLDAYSAFVALTHDPKIDDIGLDAALKVNCFYIGALGSSKNHQKRLDRLHTHYGHPKEILTKIDGPVGLDIGASSPQEIAVSILASMIMTWRKKG